MRFNWFGLCVTLVFLLGFTGCLRNPDATYANAVRNMEENRLDRAETLLLNVLEIKEDHANALYALGVLYMKQERYKEAIPRFQKALEVNPEDAEAQINLGVIFARTNQLKEAEDAYMKAIVKSPGNATVLLNLARLYAKQKKFRESRLLYEKILRSQPSLYTANKELAYIYKAEERLSDAIDQFARTLKLNRADAEVLFELGSLNFKKGNLTSASRFFVAAVAVKEDPMTFLAMGDLYQRAGKFKESIVSYQKAYDLKRDSYEATFRLATLFLAQAATAADEAQAKEDLLKAERYCLIALELNRQSSEAHKYMGILHYRFFRNEAAVESFRKSRELNAYVRETNYFQGMIALRRSDYGEAIQYFLKELMEDPGHLNTARELAKLYIQFKEWDKGIKLIRNALKLAPQDPDLLTNLGSIYLVLGDEEKEKSGLYSALESYDEAIGFFGSALKVNMDRLDALEGILKALDGARRHAVAVPYLEKMIEMNPERLELYPRLAIGYSSNQDFARAIDVLRRYLEKKSEDADIWFQLGKVYADKGDFLDGIEMFSKSIELDPQDPRKKMYLGMLFAEVNRFEEALKVLQQAMDQAVSDEVTRRRCEDLIRQILEVSGLPPEKVRNTISDAEAKKIRQSGRPRLVPGSKPYAQAMLQSVFNRISKAKKENRWTMENRKQALSLVRMRLVRNYRDLVQFKKFKDETTRRYYFLGIKKLIEIIRE